MHFYGGMFAASFIVHRRIADVLVQDQVVFSNVDMDGNNTLQIKAIRVVISTFETRPLLDSHTLRPLSWWGGRALMRAGVRQDAKRWKMV